MHIKMLDVSTHIVTLYEDTSHVPTLWNHLQQFQLFLNWNYRKVLQDLTSNLKLKNLPKCLKLKLEIHKY